jgi:hypothetical protein
MSDEPKSQLLFYQAPDGRTRVEVRMQGETVWLTQARMAELFQRERSVITKHIRNIFEEGELVEISVCANYAQTAADGISRSVLDPAISRERRERNENRMKP